MNRAVFVPTACVILSLGVVAAAPQTPQQKPTFRSSVDVVHLDVSVLDRDRKPVRGLTAKDFTVYDDGKPQDVTVFSAVDVPEVPASAATWTKNVPREIQTNQDVQNTDGRLFVLLIDDALIPNQPLFLQTARDVAKKFLEKVTPADRIAVVFSASGRSQNFTNDHAKLIESIDSLKSGYANHLRGWDTAIEDPGPPARGGGAAGVPGVLGPVTDPDIPYRSASMQTLRAVAETLIVAPQRRKALIFLSPGIAIDEMSAATLERQGPTVRAAMRDANQQLLRDMPELFLRMQRANVTIYPIDPCGAGGLSSYVMTAATGLSALRGFSDPSVSDASAPALPGGDYDWLSPKFPPQPLELARHMSSLSLSFLDTAAKNTGGLALINTNDFDKGVDRIFDENSSYYLLGYSQPSGQRPGSQHRIRVEVNRPDVFVRTRSGYFAEEAPKRGKSIKDMSPLDRAIVGPVPEGAFPMRAALAPFMVPGKKDPIVTIALGLEQPAVTERTSYAVELQTNAYLTDGTPRFIGQRHIANVILAPKPGVSGARYDLLSQVALKPGRYELRLSAYRPTDNVQGSLYADVEVPDFVNDPLSASGLVVEANPANATAPKDAFGDLLPVLPTSSREFRNSDEVRVFFRIYQGGKASLDPVAVDAKLLDDRDGQVGKGRSVIPIDQFHAGGRSAEYTFTLPLGVLRPGVYLLTFDILLRDKKVTRAMQFTVLPAR